MSWVKQINNGESGGAVTIADSQINGNIKVNGTEITVYDDTDIRLSTGDTSAGVPIDRINEISSGSPNLARFDLTSPNKLVNQNGTFGTLSNQYLTQYFEVEPGAYYTRNFRAPIAFYDANKNYLEGYAQIQDFTVPNNPAIKYALTSIPSTELTPVMYKGRVVKSTAYVKPTDQVEITSKNLIVKTYKPNAEIPLFIETHTGGKNQPIHPSVVAFDTAWNGYKFWMAYTPFPGGNEPAQENPCIAVSNDAIKWITPNGLTNPIVPAPADAGMVNYNSDTELIYNPDTGLLECWYREVIAKVENVKRVTSSNGIAWSAPEVCITTSNASLFAVSNTELQIISPTVVYESGVYKLWVYDDKYIRHYESTGAFSWVDKGFVTVEGQLFASGKMQSWHLKVFKNNKGQYEMLNNDGARDPKKGILTHFLSDDGLVWKQTDFYMYPTYGTNRWDNNGFYRSTLFQHNNKYYLIYTGINSPTGEWKLGLAVSEDETIYTLQGLDNSYKPFMAQPTRKDPTGRLGDFIYDTTLNKMIFCVEKAGIKTWIDANGTVV